MYNGFEIDHTPPAHLTLRRHYSGKAASYRKLAYAWESRGKRAGKGSEEYNRYMRLLETSCAYSELSKGDTP